MSSQALTGSNFTPAGPTPRSSKPPTRSLVRHQLGGVELAGGGEFMASDWQRDSAQATGGPERSWGGGAGASDAYESFHTPKGGGSAGT